MPRDAHDLNEFHVMIHTRESNPANVHFVRVCVGEDVFI